MRYAELMPNLPPSLFPPQLSQIQEPQQQHNSSSIVFRRSNQNSHYIKNQTYQAQNLSFNNDFLDEEINDQDLVNAGD